MTTSKTLFRCCFVAAAFASLSVGACGGGGDDDSGAGQGGEPSKGGTSSSGKGGTSGKGGSTSKGGSGGGTVTGAGICEPTCSKACATDNECETSQGELCCDFGEPGKICVGAAQCPRRCEDDSSCSTAQGEACLPTNLSTPKECVFAQGGAGLRACGGDSECSSSEVCCNIYNQAICLPAGSCPQACSESSECNTGNGESCCTTVRAVEPNLAVDGLCLNPSYTECPQTCDTSSDCRTANGAVCCNGVCAYSCPKSCDQSSDCTSPDARICCTSASARLPPPTRFFSAGPACVGTPSTCAMLGQNFGTSYCTALTGCTPPSAECAGTPFTCAYSDSYQAECDARPGCEYDPDTKACDGTPHACSETEPGTDCYANVGCSSGASGTCTGTATPCSLMPLSQCSANPGCYVDQLF